MSSKGESPGGVQPAGTGDVDTSDDLRGRNGAAEVDSPDDTTEAKTTTGDATTDQVGGDTADRSPGDGDDTEGQAPVGASASTDQDTAAMTSTDDNDDPAGTAPEPASDTADAAEPAEATASPADADAAAEPAGAAESASGTTEPADEAALPANAAAAPADASAEPANGTDEPASTAVQSPSAAGSSSAAAQPAAAPVGAGGSVTGFASGPGGKGAGTGLAPKGTGTPPRAGQPTKPPKKQRSRAVRYTRRTLFVVLGFLGLCVAGFAIAYLFTPIPSPQEQAIAQGPTFLYSDGKTPIAKTGTNRDAVKLEQVPKGVRDAVIAAENRSFYADPGVSVSGTARAFWSTVSGEQLQGGSTITQQMVRNYYGGIGTERSVTRKLKEVMVSLKVGREKPKNWILEQYLNTIYFGRDSYGVQAAAKAYYGKDVSRLTPAEGAYLAAAIQQPTNFADPSGSNRAYSEQRWRAVVANMVRDRSVSQSEAAAMKFPMPVKEKATDVLKGQKGYMVNVAKKELVERRGYSEDEINRSGLKITTTFDKRLMDAAKDAVNARTPDRMNKKIRTGLVSVDPKTGQVLAFYGGRNYLDEMLTSTFGDWAQAGSGFKPIVLAAALKDGVSLSSTFDGSSPQYYNGAPIKNNEGHSYGRVNLVTATQNSVNTAYVNIGQEIGLDKVTEMAEKMGIPKNQLTANGANVAPSFPLGVISVHPVQQAGVYATFAAEGRHRTPYVVKSVSDNKEHTRTFTEKGKQVFSAQVARDASYAMQRVVQSGTGTNAQLDDGRDIAGKTGTTENGRAIWFNGYIPQMATTVAMFRSDNKPLNIPGYGSFGGQLPAQIWNSYMSDAVDIKNYEPKEFGSPSMSTGSGYDSPPYGNRPSETPSTGPTTPTRPPTEDPDPGPTKPPTEGPSIPPTLPTDPGPDNPPDDDLPPGQIPPNPRPENGR
ncbi:transglycosylase domain-containing protein [Spirillospora sp. CA-294931]|uniref:transglycosylase domain-containing protein n=1 Tax=Spirillospora sp. CA-294931 TaxID=3240042 RepID=UPI003D8D5C83